MRNIALILIPVLLIFGCSDDDSGAPPPEWRKLGLDGYIINELELRGETLYAATDKGIFKKNLSDDENFALLGLADQNIEDILILSDTEILVTVVDRSFQTPPALYETLNGGVDWEEIEHNFGGTEAEPVFDLALREGESSVLYATGFAVVAKSSDKGRTWEPVWGDWGGFATGVSTVEVCPETGAVWAGGQGAIENGFLLYSADDSEWDSWSDLVPNPTVVKEIAFQDEGKLYVGFEGALLKTADNGASWQTVIESEENRFFFGIAIRKTNPDHVFAGGWLKTPNEQPLNLYYSRNGGGTWQTIAYPAEDFGGVYDMVSIPESARERIFVGLYKGGVYEVTLPIR